MATQHNSSNDNGVSLSVHVESELDPNSECEKLGTLGCPCPIEEQVEKISLVGDVGSQTCVAAIQGNADIINGSQDQSESESDSEEESETATASSSSSSASTSGQSSSSSSDNDDDVEEEKGEGQARHAVGVEIEEGEIRDSAAADDDSEDGDKMVSWSMVDDDDDDDDFDVVDYDAAAAAASGGPIRSKNELEELPPVPPVKVNLEPHHQMLPVGVVMSILGAQVIVEGAEKHDPLNEGSILWMTESRKPLGIVDEIFGPVKNPYYVVRYNSENEVPVGIQSGTLISFVPEFAYRVLNNKDLYKKGYDASGANDEELSDEIEFSDDEKEAECKRMQRMTKRGKNDQNPGKRKNNKKRVSPKENVIPSTPDAPAPPLLDHGNCSPFSGIGQGLFGGTTTVPPFPIPPSNVGPNFPIPPSNAGPNFATNGVWTNGTTLPQQPQPSLLPNGFPTNGMLWYPLNSQISHQLPVQGIPFHQQLHPNQGPLSTAMLPGVQPNIFAQPIYAQGLVGQNQMTFGLSSPFPQILPPLCAAQQGSPCGELQSEGNLNLHSSTIPNGPPQFHPGASASHGRKTSHGAGKKGWRAAK